MKCPRSNASRKSDVESEFYRREQRVFYKCLYLEVNDLRFEYLIFSQENVWNDSICRIKYFSIAINRFFSSLMFSNVTASIILQLSSAYIYVYRFYHVANLYILSFCCIVII